MASYGIGACHPDLFLVDQLNLDAERICMAMRQHRASLKNPPKTVEEYLVTLEEQGLPGTRRPCGTTPLSSEREAPAPAGVGHHIGGQLRWIKGLGELPFRGQQVGEGGGPRGQAAWQVGIGPTDLPPASPRRDGVATEAGTGEAADRGREAIQDLLTGTARLAL